jgi:hydrogenase maturation protein HypF
MARTAAPAVERRRIRVRGLVQGVGFRPFVYRLAADHRLTGWVRNTGAGVEIEAEGHPGDLDAFARGLCSDAPPLARLEGCEVRAIAARGDRAFRIRPSRTAAGTPLPVSPDVAPCAECLAELWDPAARRHRYPFTNCTRCGPRFTLIEALPYDRARTTMRAFPLCGACRAEYEHPADRRFHAEPIACPACGPRLELHGASGALGDEALRAGAVLLREGGILALRGLGGFQLACDASREETVARLRERKHREAKPLAVMVPDLAAARALCHLSAGEEAVLTGPRAPIVLLRRREPPGPGAPGVAEAVAPGLDTLGIMLPSTPLHHLLLREHGGPLVMTSGNRSEEPIAAANEEALSRLAGIADAFLVHDREISSRYDDSVVRVEGGEEMVLRRARGYAPEPLRLPRAAQVPILAAGPQLKSTFCLVRGDRAFVSQHLGDLDDALTLAHYHHTLELYRRLFRVEPEVVACDLHPDYASSRFARSLKGVARVAVQHHHAHVVSCLAEHGFTGSAIGVAFDGSGYGSDGAVWGGELLVAGWRGYRRAAHLAYLPLPGGDAAAREPWRMALAALAHAYGEEAREVAAMLLARVAPERRRPVLEMALRGVHAPPTSSMGRLFDAVAALAGIRDVNRYEGEAAVELEVRVGDADGAAYPLPLVEADDCAVWDPAPLIRAVVDDVRRGAEVRAIASRFHRALAAAVVEGCVRVRETDGVGTVALSGGCFQNRCLARLAREGLERAGFRVLVHRRVPPNDGGVSLGQAAVALATLNGDPE